MTEVLRRNNLHSNDPSISKDIAKEKENSASTMQGIISPASSIFKKASEIISGNVNSVKSNLQQQTPLQVQRQGSWGNVVKKDPFLDMDMLESGFAREYITEECLSPTQNDRKWTNCFVEKTEKNQYKMYEDATGRFLLSAKQEGDVFFISQYECFPDVLGAPNTNYCAVLRKTQGQPNFKLYNCGCEGCDARFMKYTCGSTFDEEQEGCDRQLLADISQFTKRIKHVEADMRCLKVIIPAVMDDKRSRVVWCPRVCGSTTPKGATPRSNPNNIVTSPRHSTRSGMGKSFESQSDETEVIVDRVVLNSKLPEWNSELKSLVLKFHGGRVLAASSKNFLLTTDSDTTKGVLQFGKSRKGRFVLDYRYPMAPIQAFGICLSSCAWSAE